MPKKIIKLYQRGHELIEHNLYRGKNVHCPICESSYKTFKAFGSRENAQCLNCRALERHRLLWIYLNEKTDIFNGEKIRLLHFAPEKFLYKIFQRDSNIDYYPCDLFPENYTYDNKIEIIKVDITKIQFDRNYFDVILCNHVLEHIPDDTRAMSELNRVMNTNGWGIFQVPIDYNLKETYEDFSITSPEARKIAFGQIDHVRMYGKDYKDRLANNGFNVLEDDFIHSLSKSSIKKMGLMDHELVYFCKKIKKHEK